MYFRKILLFIVGYVVVLAEGTIEKFINMSINRGLKLHDLKSISPSKIRFIISLNDFWGIRHIAKKTNCKVKVLDKKGLPFFWSKTKKRKFLIVGSAFFIIIIYALSNFVWFIDVTSHEELTYIDENKIIEIAKKSGLKPGIFKKNINAQQIERNIIQQIPQLSWVGLQFQGTKAIIDVVERKLPDEEYTNREPRHIVAAKDGVILEILVMMGQPMVNVGDTVERGEILISGIIVQETGEDETLEIETTPQQVRARGIVRAKVWYEQQATIDLHVTSKIRTGSKETVYYIELPDKKIVLKGSLDSTFANYETEHQVTNLPSIFKLPGRIVKTTFFEVDIVEKIYGKEEAIALAFKKFKKNLKLPENVKISDQQSKVLVETNDKVVVKLVIETIEDITKYVPIK